MRHWTIGLCFLVAMTMWAGCRKNAESNTSDEATDSKVPQLSVGHVGHDHQIALFVAALEGESFIKAHGTGLREVKSREVYDLIDSGKKVARLRFVKVGGGARMPAAMSKGHIQIGLGGVAAVTKFIDSGSPLKIIAPLQTDGDMLVMKKASAITDWTSFVKSVMANERPITIGYKAHVAVAKLILERALKAEGIKYAYERGDGVKVVLQNMRGGKNALPLLSGGSIDGFVMNQPVVAISVHKGVGKVIADLRDLPPAGKWHDHPCCCVCTTDEILKMHPDVLRAFLKVIHLGTELINSDSQLAARRASEWTKVKLAIENQSVPTIHYSSKSSDKWLAGMSTWAEMMADVGAFTGKFAKLTPQEIVNLTCDMTLCSEALNELETKQSSGD